MNKASKEKHDGRDNPRPCDLTPLTKVQIAEALSGFRTGRRIFARLRRCRPWNMLAYPSGLRLTGRQVATARCGKIIEYGP